MESCRVEDSCLFNGSIDLIIVDGLFNDFNDLIKVIKKFVFTCHFLISSNCLAGELVDMPPV